MPKDLFIERCANCTAIIGKLETPSLWPSVIYRSINRRRSVGAGAALPAK